MDTEKNATQCHSWRQVLEACFHGCVCCGSRGAVFTLSADQTQVMAALVQQGDVNADESLSLGVALKNVGGVTRKYYKKGI